MSHKHIYHPGKLRKVLTNKIVNKQNNIINYTFHTQQMDEDKPLKDITITVSGKEWTIGTLTQTPLSYKPCAPTATNATVYKAVIDQTGTLVNQGDNIVFGIGDKVNVQYFGYNRLNKPSFFFTYMYNQQIDFGELKACFSILGADYCIVQPYVPLTSNEEPILSEFDCPLLQLDDTLLNVPSERIRSAQSIVHECTTSCKWASTSTRTIEREKAQRRGMHFEHDLKNNIYSLNIYCCKALHL